MAVPYADIVATTLDAWIEKGVAFDNIFKAHPLLEWLKTHANIEQQGGYQIAVDLEYATQTGSWVSATTVSYSETFTPFITKGLDDWRTYVVNVQFNFDEKMQNRGEPQIINLIEKKIENSERSISQELETQFFGTSSISLSTPNGLLDITTASGTFMGITKGTESWWDGVTQVTSSTLTLSTMATIYNSVSGGTELPDFIVTTQHLFESYEALCQTVLRLVGTKIGDAGFQELAYKNAIMRFSGYCPSEAMFFLNSKYLYLVSAPDGFFYRDEFERTSGALRWDAPIVFYGNLLSSNCRRQGVLYAT